MTRKTWTTEDECRFIRHLGTGKYSSQEETPRLIYLYRYFKAIQIRRYDHTVDFNTVQQELFFEMSDEFGNGHVDFHNGNFFDYRTELINCHHLLEREYYDKF